MSNGDGTVKPNGPIIDHLKRIDERLGRIEELIDERLDIMSQRADVAHENTRMILEIVRRLAVPRPAGGRSPAPLKVAAKDSN